MVPPRCSTLAATSDQFPLSTIPVAVAANPSRITTIAPRRCESMTTRARTTSTIVSPIARATGTPFAANGAARKTRQSSRTRRTVRLGSLIRSCQSRIDLRRSAPAGARRRSGNQRAGMAGNHQVLVGLYDISGDAALRRTDAVLVFTVGCLVKFQPEPIAGAADRAAHRRRILSDAGGEYEA